MKRQSILASLLVLAASWSLVCATAHANSTVGRWDLGPVWDITPNNMLVLPSGKVMFYPGLFINGDDPRMWDPATNTLTPLAKAGYDIFCTGHTLLTDGTILFTGGNLTLGDDDGLPYASIYNPVTNVWTRVPDMNAGRWYPTTTATALGEALVMTGWVDDVQQENSLPQIWQPSSGTWRNLTSALLKIWYYSWVYWTPSGKAIVVGPERTTRYLDTAGTGTWTSAGSFNYPNIRDYGSSVLYSASKILIAGGGDPPTNTAEIFDLNTGTWQSTNPMALNRRHHNLVLLPDDNVLAVGGTSSPGFNDFTNPAYASEMWNTSTKTWTTMASQSVGRFYHSVAVLLPDGRVMSAGGDHFYQTELYSPPYLFKGARPTITSAPATADYSSTFFVGTPDATSIANVRLIRLPAVTHAFDQNQRIVPVSFSQTTGGLNVTAPTDPNLAPVGHYMLFILNGSGVPSVAKIILLRAVGGPPPVPAAPTGLAATAASSTTINLAWTDQSTNEASFPIERAVGAGPFVQVATVGANLTSYTDSGLTASTSYSYRVRASNAGGNSAYSNTASATTAVTPPGTINMSTVNLDTGFAYYSTQNFGTPGDTSSAPTQSLLRIFENGTELGPAHSQWSAISTTGLGRFLHWQNSSGAITLYFSASDNTNPKTNGRTYTYQVGSSPSPPAAPTSLAATAVSSSVINLTWSDQSTNETGFTIERKTDGGALAQIATVGPNVTTYADSGLTASTTYSYRVRATNSIGDSTYSNTASATTLDPPPTAPAPPTGLGATAVSSSAINLSWTDAATNEDSFKIERKTGAGAFAQIATVGPNVTTYADSGLTANTAYSYRVRASNTAGNSAYSNTASATTQAAPTAPAAPTALSATATSSTTINLGWTDAATNEDSFKIERKTGAGAFAQIATVGPDVSTYADSGLTASTSYSYRVRASNAGGNSAYSNTASATTAGPPPGTINMSTVNLDAGFAYYSTQNFGTPGDTSSAPTQSLLRIFENGTELGPAHSQWSDISTTGLGRFLHWQNSSGTITLYFSASDNTNPKTNGRTYTYQVGFSPSPPAVPTGLAATPTSSTAITLNWTDAANNEDGFKIERKTGAGAFAQIATVGPNITTYADSGLTASTAYSYQVRAYNSVGDSTYSNTASATTLDPPPTAPAPPTSLGATAISSSAITLSWTDAANNEDGFKIERKTGAGAFAQIATVGANITTYADSGLTAGTAYSYQVRATNTGGDSAYSNTASATTQAAPTAPTAPSGLSATATSSTAITLSWTDAANNEDGFKIERKTGAGAFAQIATVGPNITTYADSGLTASTAYSYQVRATNAGGDSAYSNTASATTLPAPPPAPPSGLSATATSSTAITLSWTDAANNEDGFKIERKTGAGAFAQIATVGPNITTYADSGLTASTAYSYQVRATNTGGDSAYSNTASATTLAAPPPVPAPPTGLSATAISSSAITLSWTDAANNEDGFKIERKTGAGAFAQIATVGPNITTYADSGLTAGTGYSYQVRASNTGGDSAYSNIASATTSGLIDLAAASSNSGFAYKVNQNFGTPGDTGAAPSVSVLRIFENGIELGPPHSSHADIRSLGLGRFSHWGNQLYFSASDNTDPRTNGRTYTYDIGSQP